MSGPVLINPARARIVSELEAEARREWGGDIDRMDPVVYAQMLLCLACDRIDRGEARGFARRPPLKIVNLQEHKLKASSKLV